MVAQIRRGKGIYFFRLHDEPVCQRRRQRPSLPLILTAENQPSRPFYSSPESPGPVRANSKLPMLNPRSSQTPPPTPSNPRPSPPKNPSRKSKSTTHPQNPLKQQLQLPRPSPPSHPPPNTPPRRRARSARSTCPAAHSTRTCCRRTD